MNHQAKNEKPIVVNVTPATLGIFCYTPIHRRYQNDSFSIVQNTEIDSNRVIDRGRVMNPYTFGLQEAEVFTDSV